MKRLADSQPEIAGLLAIQPSSKNLGAVLDAHLHAEQMRHSRSAVLYLLAAVGGLCWLFEFRPGIVPSRWHTVGLVAWPISLGLFLVLGLLERRWNARLLRLTKG